jgi:putative hydrolase of the HAD superfamily
LREFFEVVVDSALGGYEKPDPRIFEHALAVSGAEPATTLHVGDLYDADVLGARAAGIHAALLDPFGDWPQVDCERFRDVSELQVLICAARGADFGSRD